MCLQIASVQVRKNEPMTEGCIKYRLIGPFGDAATGANASATSVYFAPDECSLYLPLTYALNVD